MAFRCFAFCFWYVSVFHLKWQFSCIQISEGIRSTSNKYAGLCRRETGGYFYARRKEEKYGLTNHKAAGKTGPLLGTKAVRQLPERKLPAAGWIGGAQLRAAIMQKRYLLPLLSESGPSKGNEIVQTDLNAKSET